MKLIDMNYLNRICAKLDMNTAIDLTKQEKLVGSGGACLIETWLKSNEREEIYDSPYREFLAK